MPSGCKAWVLHRESADRCTRRGSGHRNRDFFKVERRQGLDGMPTNVLWPNFAESRVADGILDSPVLDQDVEDLKATLLAKLTLSVGKDAATATDRDWFVATALALRDRIIHRWLAVDRVSSAKGRKRVYYMSLEFLIGRLLNDVVGNLGCNELVQSPLGDLGVDPERMRCAEPDAALGN